MTEAQSRARKGKTRQSGLLDGVRVYLSGPMDFVASRAEEMKNGWRSRVGQYLKSLGCIVFDPWQKPEVRGLQEYGREGLDTDKVRANWTFEDSEAGARARAKITGQFWQTLHIDLRMVDTSDFVIAYCPTNIYSVGTPHEIALCRSQRKPVLFVSPPVTLPGLEKLRNHLVGDREGSKLLERLVNEVPIKPNPAGVPSLWYMPLVGGENFFDGFGFEDYRKKFKWKKGPLDQREADHEPVRPLLPFIQKLPQQLPKKWDNKFKHYVRNDDWLLWQLERQAGGAQIVEPRALK